MQLDSDMTSTVCITTKPLSLGSTSFVVISKQQDTFPLCLILPVIRCGLYCSYEFESMFFVEMIKFCLHWMVNDGHRKSNNVN